MTESSTTTTAGASAGSPIFRNNPPTAVPCPDWCTDPAGHPFDDAGVPGESATRYHHVEFADDDRNLAADITHFVQYEEGHEVPVSGEPPYIQIWIGGNAQGEIHDPEVARRLASYLTMAANALERFQA